MVVEEKKDGDTCHTHVYRIWLVVEEEKDRDGDVNGVEYLDQASQMVHVHCLTRHGCERGQQLD